MNIDPKELSKVETHKALELKIQKTDLRSMGIAAKGLYFNKV